MMICEVVPLIRTGLQRFWGVSGAVGEHVLCQIARAWDETCVLRHGIDARTLFIDEDCKK